MIMIASPSTICKKRGNTIRFHSQQKHIAETFSRNIHWWHQIDHLFTAREASSSFRARDTVRDKPFVSRLRGSTPRSTFRRARPYAVRFTADYTRRSVRWPHISPHEHGAYTWQWQYG